MTFRQQLMLTAAPRVLLVGMIAGRANGRAFYIEKVIQSAMKGCLWLPKKVES